MNARLNLAVEDVKLFLFLIARGLSSVLHQGHTVELTFKKPVLMFLNVEQSRRLCCTFILH